MKDYFLQRLTLAVIGTSLFIIGCRMDSLSEVNSTSPQVVRAPSISIVFEGRKGDIGKFRLINEGDLPVFVIYERGDDSAFVPYQLDCGADRFGPEWHTLPERKSLTGQTSIEFEVELPVAASENCTLSVRYFDNSEAVATHERFVEDSDFNGYSDQEKAMIANSAKDATCEFPIN